MKTIQMARKKREVRIDITPGLLKFREKKKWQIALRRYVLEKNPCVFYAPYFGLDTQHIRQWFEMQFPEGTSWEDFGKKWQFDHVIPVTCFDFDSEGDLKICWNFTNLRVDLLGAGKERGNGLDVLAAKGYFEKLWQATNYNSCLQALYKIEQLQLSGKLGTEKQEAFIKQNRGFLDIVENYSGFEFELLNRGRTPEQVNNEVAFFKKFDK